MLVARDKTTGPPALVFHRSSSARDRIADALDAVERASDRARQPPYSERPAHLTRTVFY
jgi:hypothetical protein